MESGTPVHLKKRPSFQVGKRNPGARKGQEPGTDGTLTLGVPARKAAVSLLIQECFSLGKHFRRKEGDGNSRVEPLAAPASREKRFKNQTRTQNDFCQSHSLDAHFCRGGVPYLGELTQGFRQHFQQSQGGRSTRGLGAPAGPLQASGRAPERSSASTPPLHPAQKAPARTPNIPQAPELLYKPADSIV